MNNKQINNATRGIYLKQHNNYLTDEITFQRFLNMVNDLTYFHLTTEDFKGKRILDVGCGNTGYFQVAMSNLGVEHITCLDLGTD